MKQYEEADELLETQKTEAPKIPPRGGSLAGVHFASLYDACQRKFHMKFNLGIDEKYVDKALIFGSAIHEAKAVYYLTGSEDEATARGEQECDDRKGEFYSPDDYEFSRGRVKPLMNKWYQDYGGHDLEKYNVLAVEEEIRLPVPFTPGFIHTQRHDAVLEERSNGNVFTFDTKTASSSLDFTLNSVRLSDQVTSYNWGGVEVFGARYKGFVIDVQYWSSRSANPGTIKCARSEPITRSGHELKVFQAQIGGLFNEIQAKERALALGTPSPLLYRRNTFYCMSFYRKCSYADVCPMADRDIPKRLPDHLVIDQKPKSIDGMTYDNIYYGEGPI
jgi:hypothetical protein